jgi:hypothetical protein
MSAVASAFDGGEHPYRPGRATTCQLTDRVWTVADIASVRISGSRTLVR